MSSTRDPTQPHERAAAPVLQTATDGGVADDPTRSVLHLLRDVQRGTIAPTSLAKHERRLCVEHLTAEGYSVAEIAEILKTADRTIFRDRQAIRQANAIEASSATTKEMIGLMVREAETAISRIRRFGRGTDVAAEIKIAGERHCWEIIKGLVTGLQKLGVLPLAVQPIAGTITHRAEPPSILELNASLEQLFSLASDDPAALARLNPMRQAIAQLGVAEQIQSVETSVIQPSSHNEKDIDDDQD